MKKKKRFKLKTAIFAAATTVALATPAVVAPISTEATTHTQWREWVWILKTDHNILMRIDGERVTGQWGGRTIRLVHTENGNFYTRTLPNEPIVKEIGTFDIYDLTDSDKGADAHKMLKSGGKFVVRSGGRTITRPTLDYYSVTFYGDREKSEKLETSLVLSGNSVKEPDKPTSEGKTFIEWVDKDGKRFDFSAQSITGKTEVFAKWDEPTEPVTGPTEPVTEPTEPVTGPTEPVTGPTEPVTEPTEPVTGPTEPVTGPTEPVTGPTEPVTGPTEPVTEPTEPVTGPTEPVTRPTEPVTRPTEPVTRPTEPVTEPVTEPTEPITGPTEPTVDKREQAPDLEQNELLAKQNELLAQQNELLAKQNELLAKQNELLAKQNELLAKQNELLAQQNELLAQQND